MKGIGGENLKIYLIYLQLKAEEDHENDFDHSQS